MNNFKLSKSSFLKFEQCAKSFFLHTKAPHLKDQLSTSKALTFKRGYQVGEAAKALFPGGTDVMKEAKNLEERVKLTQSLLVKQLPIYEAAFSYQEMIVLVDILVVEDGKWNAYEVKSSLKISETYLVDACVQYYVLKNTLPELNDFYLVTLNGDYILQETLSVKELFKKRSVKKEGEKNLAYFEERIRSAKLVLEKNTVPDVPIGAHCTKPYTCDFYGTCWKDFDGKESIFHLPGINRNTLHQWFSEGKQKISDIPLEELSPKVKAIAKCFLDENAMKDESRISTLIERVKTPFAGMDMEIWSPAIPELKGTRPFQQTPFLFTLCSETENSFHFSAFDGNDDRREFASKLIELTLAYSTLLVYDSSTEEQTIRGLTELFPDIKEALTNVRNKIVDISWIFKDFAFYDPRFTTNFSLKTIAEVLTPDLKFGKISGGLEAMSEFEKYRRDANPIYREMIRQEIIDYCMADSKATLELFLFLVRQ